MNELLDFLKIISDETRLRILMILYQKELCVCELCDVLEESQPKISRHLGKLRDSGLVKDERQGQWIFYCLTISNNEFYEIMTIINTHIKNYSRLEKDLEKLNRKISNNKLCLRNKK